MVYAINCIWISSVKCRIEDINEQSKLTEWKCYESLFFATTESGDTVSLIIKQGIKHNILYQNKKVSRTVLYLRGFSNNISKCIWEVVFPATSIISVNTYATIITEHKQMINA